MASLNSFNFTGRLGKDPEIRSLPDGKEICNFSVAIDRYGEKPPLWVEVGVFGGAVAPCGRYLSKGSQVAIHAQVEEVRLWESNGNHGASLKVSTRDVTFIGSKQDGQSDVPANTSDFQPVATGGGAATPSPVDDDIPFAPSTI